jgi:hypothetical protein
MTKADGTFTLDKVTPAKVLSSCHERTGRFLCEIDSVRAAGDARQDAGSDPGSGRRGCVVLQSGAAEVSGTVQTKQESTSAGDSSALVPASSASIVLVPEDLTLNGGDVHTANTNQNGAFTAKGLAPGRYYALAYEADEYRNFDDPAILKQLVDKGSKVEVKENDKQQIQLTLLPPEDLQAALTAAGVEN